MGMLSDIYQKIFPSSSGAVDVEALLNERARQAIQPMNWRGSIFDLLQLLGLDGSLRARKALARELYYSGDPNYPASMNVWLHRQVMTKLAQHGGMVPADLRD